MGVPHHPVVMDRHFSIESHGEDWGSPILRKPQIFPEIRRDMCRGISMPEFMLEYMSGYRSEYV